MALLHGRAGRLTAENGGFRPGQAVEVDEETCGLDHAAQRFASIASLWESLREAARPIRFEEIIKTEKRNVDMLFVRGDGPPLPHILALLWKMVTQ